MVRPHYDTLLTCCTTTQYTPGPGPPASLAWWGLKHFDVLTGPFYTWQRQQVLLHSN